MQVVSATERDWFSGWLARDRGFLPGRFRRSIATLYLATCENEIEAAPALPSDAEPVGEPTRAPEREPDSAPKHGEPAIAADGPSDVQIEALDRLIMDSGEAGTPCTIALYAGDIDAHRTAELIAQGLTPVAGRLPYLLYAAPLAEGLFAATTERWGDTLPQCFLWPEDRSWFVASAPDLPYTVVGCGDAFAERLLAEPALEALEWRGNPVRQ